MAVSVAALEQAITDILTTGQSYSRAGFTLTRANLKDLRAELKIARAASRRSSGSGAAMFSDFSKTGDSSDSDWGD